MAFRVGTYWKTMINRVGGRANFTTETSPKLKAYNPAVDHGFVSEANSHHKPKPVRGEFIPVYVAIGMIAMSASLGLYTAMHQFKCNPSVQVKKSRRETILEVEDPDVTVSEGEKFIKESFFRKLAHIQAHPENPVPDYIRSDPFGRPAQAETLKTVGVNP